MITNSTFERAHNMYLSPMDTPPEYDEWEDAQYEKCSIIDKFNKVNDTNVSNIDEMDTEISQMVMVPESVKQMRNELARLEEDFPCKVPDMDGE